MNRSCMHCDSFPVYYADKYDQLVFMQKFQDGRQYCNNLAAVKKNGKWGFMDRNGNIIAAPNPDCRIIIQDNGYGMSFEDIRDKWMVIGTASKRKKPYSPEP